MCRRGPWRVDVARRAQGVLLEALFVIVVGTGFALLANAVSPRGLPLIRHPSLAPAKRTLETGGTPSPLESGRAASPSLGGVATGLAARLESRGLTLVNSNQVEQLFRDPRRDAELVVFVDARDAPQYEDGHIPAAYLLDPYRPEHGLASVLAVGATAEQVVVYCRGGDCEDSELAAGLLLASGIPGSRVLVYGGGFDEWTTNGLPVEVGARHSGRMRSVSP